MTPSRQNFLSHRNFKKLKFRFPAVFLRKQNAGDKIGTNSDVTPVLSFAEQNYGARREDSARAQRVPILTKMIKNFTPKYFLPLLVAGACLVFAGKVAIAKLAPASAEDAGASYPDELRDIIPILVAYNIPLDSLPDQALTGLAAAENNGLLKAVGNKKDDLFIPQGGGLLIAKGAKVEGNITFNQDSTIVVGQDAYIKGDINGNGGTIVFAGGVLLNGNLKQLEGNQVQPGIVRIDKGRILGSVELAGNASVELKRSTIGLSSQAEGDAPVPGQLVTRANQSMIFHSSTINGDFVSENDGAVIVAGTILEGNLSILNPSQCDDLFNQVEGTNSGCPKGVPRNPQFISGDSEPCVAFDDVRCDPIYGDAPMPYDSLLIFDVLPPQWVKPIGSSMRIGTFNLQGLSDDGIELFTGNLNIYDSIPERMEKIAARIIDSGYDVIALNEVFRERDQNTLARILRDRGGYTSFVLYLDGEGAHLNVGLEEYPADFEETKRILNSETYEAGSGCPLAVDTWCQDSGLMLFSKFPFLPLPDTRFRVDRDNVKAFSAGRSFRDVAFVEFPYCTSSDCMANKGAGLVRIQHPGGSVYNIVFTHTQSGNDNEDTPTMERAVRRWQLNAIEELITGTLTEAQRDRQQIILMGDMNIEGHKDYTRKEWYDRFSERSTTPFFYKDLREVWQYGSQFQSQEVIPDTIRDVGKTFRADTVTTQRLDYILRNDGTDPLTNRELCYQHITIAKNLWDDPIDGPWGFGRRAGKQPLSDHIGMNADINSWSEHCSPNIANYVPKETFNLAPPAPPTLVFEGADVELKYPGSMQWYLLDPGTYSFDLSPAEEGVQFEIYESMDISRPLWYNGETTPFEDPGGFQYVGKTYDLIGNKKYYVRVFNPDRTWSGAYRLAIHRHNCMNRDAPCGLSPNRQTLDEYEFPDPNLFPDEHFYFKMDTDSPYDGGIQHLEFSVDPSGGVFKFEVQDYLHTFIEDNDPFEPINLDDRAYNQARLYMVVQRKPNSPLTFTPQWTTNLRIIEPLNLRVGETTDESPFGTDTDVTFQIQTSASPAYEGRVWMGDFDNGDGAKAIKLDCPIGYVWNEGDPVELMVQLTEDDGDPEYMTKIFEFSAGFFDFDVIKPDQKLTIYSDEGDGDYSMKYNVHHGTQNLRFHTVTGIGGAEPIRYCNEKDVQFDSDVDGIVDRIDPFPSISGDRDPTTDWFSDYWWVNREAFSLGETNGAILERGDRVWRVEDMPDNPGTPRSEGVRLIVGPGMDPAKVYLPAGFGLDCFPSRRISIPFEGTGPEGMEFSCWLPE